jgi:hypothetical protein
MEGAEIAWIEYRSFTTELFKKQTSNELMIERERIRALKFGIKKS